MVPQINSVPIESRHSGISSCGGSMPSSKAYNPPRPFNPHSSEAGTWNLEYLEYLAVPRAGGGYNDAPRWINDMNVRHTTPTLPTPWQLHQPKPWSFASTKCEVLSSHGVIGALNYRFLAQQLQISSLCACTRVLVKQCRVIPFPYVQYPLEILMVYGISSF